MKHAMILAAGLLFCMALPRPCEAKSAPNILFIFADDQAYDTLGALGTTAVKTPNLDKLINGGVHFTHTYNMGAWGGAVCVASRAMLNSGAFLNRANACVKKNPHWSQMMKQAGYKTYMTGKWHVPGAPRFDVVKDVRPGMPKAVSSGYNRPKDPQHYASGWKPWDKANGGFWQGGTHWTQVVGDNSVEFLKQAAKDDAQFLMYLAFNAPHDPRQAPKEYVDMYPLDSLKVPDNFMPMYPFKDKIGCGKGLRDEKLAPFPRTEYAVKVNRQEYFACITYVDVQVGRILEALKETGKADNTYVIYTADHGLAVGRHGLLGKQNMYEHSMRPPFIMSGPGLKPGTRIDTPIYLQDAMATALELAGAKRPDYVEFKSLMPLIRGERKVQYESIYGKYMNSQRMIMKDGWKLMMYPSAGKERLYHLKEDPLEMKDLRDDPKHATVVRDLKAAYEELRKQMGDDLDVDKPSGKKKRR